jgi:hypothetical protein
MNHVDYMARKQGKPITSGPIPVKAKAILKVVAMPAKSNGKNYIAVKSGTRSRPGVTASVRPNAKHKPRNPGHPVRIETRQREEQALALRKQGYTYPEIGKQLGISTATAFQMVMRVLAAYEDGIKELVPRVRQLELERCDTRTKALSKKVAAGDTHAILTDIKVSERRAKLMGLDAPTEVHSTSEIQLVPDADLDAEIRQLNASLGMIAEGMNPVRIVDVVSELEEATVEVER